MERLCGEVDEAEQKYEVAAAVQRVLHAHKTHAWPIAQWHADLNTSALLPDSERLSRQRHAITAAIQRTGIAASAATTVVEFGAGDGSLSRTLWRAGVGAKHLLIDRSQKKLGMATTPAAAGGFDPQQLCADATTLGSDALRSAVTADAAVAISNHMCGCAVDASIRCAVGAWTQQEQNLHDHHDSELTGVVAVTCCHHQCTWELYLGQPFFEAAGLSRGDFELMKLWSRFAPRRQRSADTRPRVVAAAHQLGLTPVQAAELGVRCRHLLDSGRADYLRRNGFDVALGHHVPFALTADNLMILAQKGHNY